MLPFNPLSPNFLWHCAIALSHFSHKEFHQEANRIAALLNIKVLQTLVFRSIRNIPAHCLILTNEFAVLLAQGVSSVQQAISVTMGGIFPGNVFGAPGQNKYYEQYADTLGFIPRFYGLPTFFPVVLVGHSYGGAACAILAGRLREKNPNREIVLITMGAPKADGLDLVVKLKGVAGVRLITHGDPVPSLPPSDDEAGVFAPLIPILLRSRLNSFIHPQPATLLSFDGTMKNVGYVRGTPEEIGNALSVIRGGELAKAAGSHLITVYRDRLERAKIRDLFAKSTPVVPALDTSRQGVNIFNQRSRIMPVYIPPRYRAKPTKIGTYWGAIWMNSQIGRFEFASPCRTFCKYFNRMLQRLQLMSDFTTDNFEVALANYLTVATDPSGGFIPPMPS